MLDGLQVREGLCGVLVFEIKGSLLSSTADHAVCLGISLICRQWHQGCFWPFSLLSQSQSNWIRAPLLSPKDIPKNPYTNIVTLRARLHYVRIDGNGTQTYCSSHGGSSRWYCKCSVPTRTGPRGRLLALGVCSWKLGVSASNSVSNSASNSISGVGEHLPMILYQCDYCQKLLVSRFFFFFFF